MWTVKHANFAEEPNGNATTLPFRYVGTQCNKQGLDILPRNICADWMGEDRLERLAVCALHT
jgi:hypothetical protein